MQLLFYLCVLTWFINITIFGDIFKIAKDVYSEKLQYKNLGSATAILVAYSITSTLSILILLFFRFHCKLVMENKTTIESLDKQNFEANKKV